MTEDQYSQIAAACDRLLRAPDTSLARVAIPTLHVINEHPNCTAVYGPAPPMRTLAAWEDPPRAALRAARAVARAWFRDRSEPTAAVPVDVLVVSHLVNRRQLEQKDDFYFGPLQRILTENGATSVLTFVNHLPLGPAHNPFARPILPDYAPPAIEAKLWLQSLRARNGLRAAARATHDPVVRTMATLASRHAWLASTVNNLRLHWSIAEICKAHRPRIVLTTYEGEACERLIWHAARSNSHKPLCIGYQHAQVLPRSHAIRRSVGVPGLDCDPDVVLTSGDRSHAALESSPDLGGVKFILYGSHRNTQVQRRESAARAAACLVLPDAAVSEWTLLFEFATACARQLPGMTFKLRPHPAADVQSVLNTMRGQCPANVILSTDTSLAEDCSHADCCLYRGSSAVVQAVMAGIRPFYVARAHELPFDPLAGMWGWRETVSSPGDFVARAQTAGSPLEWESAVNFCQRNTSPLKPEALTQVLNMIRP